MGEVAVDAGHARVSQQARDLTALLRRAVKVAGTLDGHPFEATLMPSGNGPHWMPLRTALCKAIGKADAGEEVDVHLQQRMS